MKLSILFSIVFLLFYNLCFAQKQIFDTSAFYNWTKLQQYGISDNGKYCWYSQGTETKKTMLVKYTNGILIKEIPEVSEGQFSPNSGLLFYQKGDSLWSFDIGRNKVSVVDAISDFRILSGSSSGLLLYTTAKGLHLRYFSSGETRFYKGVTMFKVNDAKTAFAFQMPDNKLLFYSVVDRMEKLVCNSSGIGNVVFDNSGNGIAFTITEKDLTSILYWNIRSSKINTLVTNRNDGIDDGFEVADQPISFSSNGSRVYFKLKKVHAKSIVDKEPLTADVNIYSYQDAFLKGQRNPIKSWEFFSATCNIVKKNVVQIDNGKRFSVYSEFGNYPVYGNKYVLVQNPVNEDNKLWDEKQRPIYQLLDLDDGTLKTPIPSDQSPVEVPKVSPTEKFVVWMDQKTKDFNSWEVSTGKIRNLTARLKLNADMYWQDQYYWIGSSKFSKDFSFVKNTDVCLLRDKYDIWQVDCSGTKSPMNLCDGYGRANDVQFKLLDGSTMVSLDRSRRLIVSLFDNNNNNNGFAEVWIGSPGKFRIICSDPCLYYWGFSGRAPQRARNAEVYLLTKETANAAPNVVVSTDLKRFQQISEIQPQNQFNWLSSELVKWPMYDGKIGKGILYRPENFKPNIKYPVIFHYYQIRNDELHKFWDAEPPGGMLRGNNINIPEYVSSGYLVFVPDIVNDRPGQIAGSTVNAVESAAKYLIQNYPFIDEERLGLQGHSFGGYETNLLVANSNLFAAANASASITDLVSEYGSRTHGLKPAERMVEVGQFNLGANVNPWLHPDVYLKNSPIFQADRIKTPLLLSVGGNDSAVLPTQGFELFVALRRLGKPCWLLEYAHEDHLLGRKAAEDFAIRQRQFFDTYLMRKPAPNWMSQGSD